MPTILRESDVDRLCRTIFREIHAIGVGAVQHHHAILKNDSEQTPKAKLDFIEIVEDVGMIKLDIVYDHRFRQVMNKLRALIEESGVILVAFNYKIFRII